MEHVSYPHEPGRLYDCPACEAECFCGDLARETVCVHCAEHEGFVPSAASEYTRWSNGELTERN